MLPDPCGYFVLKTENIIDPAGSRSHNDAQIIPGPTVEVDIPRSRSCCERHAHVDPLTGDVVTSPPSPPSRPRSATSPFVSPALAGRPCTNTGSCLAVDETIFA